MSKPKIKKQGDMWVIHWREGLTCKLYTRTYYYWEDAMKDAIFMFETQVCYEQTMLAINQIRLKGK